MTGEQTTFESLAELIGKAGTLNLCEQHGGETLYVRKSEASKEELAGHWSECLGPDVYERLCERLGGQRVYIPVAPPELIAERNTAIADRYQRGESAKDIARDFQLTPRSVHSIYCRLDRERLEQDQKGWMGA